ncbi:PREDICTED: multiple C2 and transmembrane domain-containing protein 2-like [Myotis davidii]|uniref:multiple C2 and transmembrane domain-containing protein 2-like n=1 Tax=Myotis davidii TaxID=225400 RepID=UPI000767960E|nr:PREDICTED: multiple C2 and transmembrane domain-containing protein 2-like [Myotis davidii]
MSLLLMFCFLGVTELCRGRRPLLRSHFRGLHAAMDLDKPSVWGSFKQRTRPLLLNLSKKKVKKHPDKPPGLGERHRLDRRLSLSVPDLLEAQSSYISVPSSLSTAGIVSKSCSSSLKQSEEELDWSQEEGGHLHAADTDSEETFASPAADRRASSNGLFDLLEKAPPGEDVSEDPEVRPGTAPSVPLRFSFLFIY